MPVPDFQAIMLPLLKLAGDGAEHEFSAAVDSLAAEFELTDDERAELLPSGRYPRFRQRVGWAKTYLSKADLLSYGGRASFRITKRGLDLLAEHPQRIDIAFLRRYPEFEQFRSAARAQTGETGSPVVDQGAKTPREVLESSFIEIRATLAQELLDRVKGNSWESFQTLVVRLLARIYRLPETDTALVQVVGRPGDRGIDGIIRLDPLGLESVYIQAKRYTDNSVGGQEVRNFAGSLLQHKASKGVLITTSSFSPEARLAAEAMDRRIILIDGRYLAELMIDYGVGVIEDQAYVVKRIDSDYFELQ